MHYLALCCDYDGTLAHDGVVDEATIAALTRFKKSARKLLLVTGRELPDLQAVFPRLDLFDYVVAENGALLYQPSTRDSRALGKAPAPEFVASLRERGVTPLSVGQVIVATWEPHERTVLECIRDLGLELQVIFNKGAVMVLPASINKATGLTAALRELKMSARNAVGVGDAENDHAFLAACECAVAVANALPAVKERTDFVTRAHHGAGVCELIDELLRDDLAGRAAALQRRQILLGHAMGGEEFKISPRGFRGLLLGTSGSGKSTIATGLLERLDELGYTYCVIDPEGDYTTIENAVTVGTKSNAPDLQELGKLLDEPTTSAVVNLLGVPFADRPPVFAALIGQLREQRGRTGRPHWLIVDEAHHLLPADVEASASNLSALFGVLLVTVHANIVAPSALRAVNTVIVTGTEPARMLAEFAAMRGLSAPSIEPMPLTPGEALVWRMGEHAPVKIRVAESRTERRRHVRKYAEGELPEDRSFYFRGPEDRLNLRAQNLILFLQLAEGVDAETWLHHLQRHDYSTWMRDCLKDTELAAAVHAVEERERDAMLSRKLIRSAVEDRYTLPASAPAERMGAAADA